MDNCTFCNILNHSDDSGTKVTAYGSGWASFYPLREVTPGHTLVIPTHHVENFLELDPLDAVDLQRGVQLVGNTLMEQTGALGMNLISSHGEAATQTQFHLHYHLVPRYADDDMLLWDASHIKKKTEPEKLRRVLDTLTDVEKQPQSVIELAVEAYRTI